MEIRSTVVVHPEHGRCGLNSWGIIHGFAKGNPIKTAERVGGGRPRSGVGGGGGGMNGGGGV